MTLAGTNYRIPSVDPDKCHTCKSCLARRVCRLKALTQFEAHEMPYVDVALCRGCLICAQECPFGAISSER